MHYNSVFPASLGRWEDVVHIMGIVVHFFFRPPACDAPRSGKIIAQICGQWSPVLSVWGFTQWWLDPAINPSPCCSIPFSSSQRQRVSDNHPTNKNAIAVTPPINFHPHTVICAHFCGRTLGNAEAVFGRGANEESVLHAGDRIGCEDERTKCEGAGDSYLYASVGERRLYAGGPGLEGTI